jgi:hypothetical protein
MKSKAQLIRASPLLSLDELRRDDIVIYDAVKRIYANSCKLKVTSLHPKSQNYRLSLASSRSSSRQNTAGVILGKYMSVCDAIWRYVAVDVTY